MDEGGPRGSDADGGEREVGALAPPLARDLADEHVGPPVGGADVDRVAGPDVPAHRLREGGDLVGPLVKGQLESPPDDVVIDRVHRVRHSRPPRRRSG